ncbi:alpha/beta hydrolase [Nocardia sp. BMG111209]|uniref:alpha/beta hydrolase n=1 Tax=Nocardia sp. BMG111209 TaxID=1160137 RepID=UPI00039E8CA2|nr:alpha/beta hydrolase [Nocardia sp. BMG111209]
MPTSVSGVAPALLGMGLVIPAEPWPPVADRAAWREMIDKREAMIPVGAEGPMVSSIFGMADAGVPAEVEDVEIDGVPVYVATPDGVAPDDRRVYLALHGGAFIQGGGNISRLGAVMTAGTVGARTWAVDYRMPPEHPFPAALDDCLTVYRRLLADRSPADIVVGGVSAGANLVAALILRARDEGLPLPAAAVLETIPADMSLTGDSLHTNRDVDITFVGDLEPVVALYADGHDPLDPYLSPLYGDFTAGFPPTVLTTGTRDFLLSDTVRMHRRLLAAGITAELHVFEAAPHAMFLGMAPEDHERGREIRAFAERHWAAPAPRN